MTAAPVLEVCRRCGSPFLQRCTGWRVVRCQSCAWLHVLDEAGGFVDDAVPTAPVLVPEPAVDGEGRPVAGMVRVHRFTASRVCEWVARRRDIGVQESLTG